MAVRKIIIGDQEVEIPDLNFKIIPVLIIILFLWLLTGIYSVGPDEVGVVRTFGKFSIWNSPLLFEYTICSSSAII